MKTIVYLITISTIIFLGWAFKDVLFGIGYH